MTMSPERVLAALETGAMISMTDRASGVGAPRRRRIRHRQIFRAAARDAKPSPQSMCAAGTAASRIRLAGPGWNGWGVNTLNTRFQDAAMAGFTAARCPPEAEMGVRFSGRRGRRRAAHRRRRPRVRRQPERQRLRAQRRDRLHPLVVSGRRRGARRRQPRPHRHQDRVTRYAAFIGDRAAQCVCGRCRQRAG